MKYKVKAPDGRTVVISGDSAPTDADLDEIFANLPAKQTEKMEITPEVLKQRDELLKDAGIDTSGSSVASSGVAGFGKGVLGGAERIAGGATLGLSDWLGDKLGTGVKERRQELEELNPAIKGINLGTELVGGALTGGGLYKGVAKGLGAIPKVGKAAQYLAPTVTGAVSGGAYSGFENDSLDSAKTGALMGGAIGGASDLALRGLGKVWSAASKVKNTPRGFENAVGTKEGARTLNRSVRESDKIAEEVYAKAPEALETLNARAMDKLDEAVKGGVDVKGTMASAKKAYGDFIDTNKANQVISNPSKERLSQFQAQSIFNIRDQGIKGNTENLINRANKSAIDIDGDIGHLVSKRGRGKYTRTLSNTIENPDITYSYDGKNYKIKKYDGVLNSKKEPFFDLVIEKDGKLYNKFVPDNVNYISNQLKMPTQNMSLSGRIAGVEGTYPPPTSNYNISYPMTNVKQNLSFKDLGIKGLTEQQNEWLNQAWKDGLKNTTEKAGSLGHLDEMSKSLNDMISGSMKPSQVGVGMEATKQTQRLQVVKDKLDDIIEKSGLQSIKAQYRQAKTLEDSFNRGLKFKPTEIKTRDLTFKTPEEKSAFAQGLIEQIKMNPETRNIAGKARDLRGALRKVLGDDAKGVFNEIDNINKSYKNVEKILGNAERKLSVPEPINGRIGLLRELIESPGSLVGGTADFARRWGTAKSAERAAKYLLNPNLKIGKSPYDVMRPYLPTLGSILETNVMKGEQ